MKLLFKLKFMPVTAFIALCFIISAHATKPHSLNKIPTHANKVSHVSKSTKSLLAKVTIAAIWNDDISSISYLKPGQEIGYLKKKHFY